MPVKIMPARFPEQINYSASEMTTLANQAIRVMFRRWDRAQDLGDAPAPPLSTKYKERWKDGKVAWKSADRGYRAIKMQKGGSGVRDLSYTGKMRHDIQVLSATTNQAVIGAASPESSAKLFYNQRRHRMFGVSLKDWDEIRMWLRNFKQWALPKAA